MTEDEDQMGAAIACYLAQQGAQLSHKNQQGKTPMDVISDPRTAELVKQFAIAQYVTYLSYIIESLMQNKWKTKVDGNFWNS